MIHAKFLVSLLLYIPSINYNKQSMSELKISSILERPLTPQHWPNLETIMKILNDYINQCIKNRQYIEAQKAKEKIGEVQHEIKKRNRNDIELRQKRASEEMMKKHEEEANRVVKEWEVSKRKIEIEFEELIGRKMEKQQLEKEKHLQQIEIALPLNASPDKELFQLRHEEEQSVRMGNFIEAQRIKVQISKRQQNLSIKNNKLRESNIRIMMGQLQYKHKSEIQLLEAKRDERFAENDKKRKKKEKQLFEKQDRELKELHWIYGEEKKRFK